jgi:hypothetical protein
MAETIRIVEYFYATVGDQPGEGRRLLEHLSEQGLNLIAFTGFPLDEEHAQLVFFPDRPELLKTAAADAGIPLVGPKRAFLIQGEDRIGALHDYHLRLANAGVNVHASNGVVDGSGRFGYVLWVKPEHFDKASHALGV